MKCLAITGGIGSGKSYIAKLFATMGVPTYNADLNAKALYDKDEPLLQSVVNLLGPQIIKDGKIDRAVMASIVFNDRKLLLELESIVHPAVHNDFMQWKNGLNERDAKFVAFESAIYFEKPAFANIGDKALYVSSPLDLRVSRVVKRDNVTPEKVFERISNQLSEEVCLNKADFVIVSNNVDPVLPQVVDVYNKMTEL